MNRINTSFFRHDGQNLLYLTLISVILFIAPLFFLDMPGGDETRVAGIAAEMLVDGDWITPRLNGTVFPEYPPLCYVAEAVCFRLFGFTPFAAKLPLALSALAGVLMLYGMMRKLGRPKWESFAGAFMLATGAQYLFNACDCRVDMMLTAFCTLSWYGFTVMEFSGSSAARRLTGMLMLAAGIAGGVLTKNLPGIAIPLSGIGCAVLFGDLMDRRFSLAVYVRLAGAVLLGLLPYALYLVLLYRINGASAVETILISNNLGRFSGTGSHADHGASFWFYLRRLPGLFQPYLIFLFAGLFLRGRALFRHRSSRDILPLSLLLIPFLLLSIASGKRQVYLLPLSAPTALVAASSLPYIAWLCRRFIHWRPSPRVRQCLRFLPLFAAILIAAAGTAVNVHVSRLHSFAPAFAEAERLRLTIPGGRLVLVRARERLLGAAFFYCRRITPELDDFSGLQPTDIAIMSLDSEDPLPETPPGFAVHRFPEAELIVVFPSPQ